MPLTFQLTGVEWDVREVPAKTPPPESKPFTIRMLFMVDPMTGIAVQVPFEEKEADEIGDALKGKGQGSGLVMADATQMPPTPGPQGPPAGGPPR